MRTTENRARPGLWIPFLLLISLACNLWLIGQVRAHRTELLAQLNRIAHTEGSLRHEIDHLSHRLAQVERGPAWVVDAGITWDADRYATGQLPVRLHWGFTEIADDAVVSVVYYPAGNPDETRVAAAVSVEGQAYSVELLLDPSVAWQYRIVVTSGGLQRSTEVQRIDLGKLTQTLLILQPRASGRSEQWSYEIRERHGAELADYRVADVRVESIGGEGPGELTVEPLGERGWLVSAVTDSRSFVLRCTFTLNNGTAYRAEIPANQGTEFAIPPR